MDIYEALTTRRSIRDFELVNGAPRSLEPELINRIISAGFTAPTNNHMREWHFVLLNDLTKREQLIKEVIHPLNHKRTEALINRWGLTDPDQRTCYLDAVPKQFAMLMQSGCLIMPFYLQPGNLLKPKNLQDLNAFASIWLCIENILLAAASEGIFGVVRIPTEKERKTIKTFLNIPDGYEIPCWLPLGYPAADAFRVPQVKINPADRIHLNDWNS